MPILCGENHVWTFEQNAKKKGYAVIAGVDEVGRGPLAGPVVSAAVVLDDDFSVVGIKDSKQLSPGKRDNLYHQIFQHARDISLGMVENDVIDQINILQAARLSMLYAVEKLRHPPDYLLIDGIYKIESPIPQETIKKGDQRSISIAAASIIAKVTRDRLMTKYATEYPQYGFEQHKGYGTKKHRDAIKNYGVCPIHRKTFKGCLEYA
jgi:ribonuclease HII